MSEPIVIVGMARTAMGGFQGDLKDVAAPQLGAAAIRAALETRGLRRGAASLCIGGGEATALAVERA